MSAPSVLVTGGLDGVGKEICDYFAPNSMGISRRNGFDIGRPEDHRRIVELSLQHDIFVNHAHNGHFSGQTDLLYEVFEAWEKNEKSGFIVSTGSFATYMPQGGFKRYSVLKRALEIANQQCCKKIETGLVPFRMTLIKPGMLDTPASREKPHWSGNGVRGRDLAELIRFLYTGPKDLLMNEVTLSAILPQPS
ncbi:MAG: hypothetical protein H6624_20135 [Bdellovibrionaceae bacterium]|nr:hypothetical protein [Bdellovibrionales bacterium]MCB9086662.1 hypothetical protein [Pseudobdellovibrionaceae bacterium]